MEMGVVTEICYRSYLHSLRYKHQWFSWLGHKYTGFRNYMPVDSSVFATFDVVVFDDNCFFPHTTLNDLLHHPIFCGIDIRALNRTIVSPVMLFWCIPIITQEG